MSINNIRGIQNLGNTCFFNTCLQLLNQVAEIDDVRASLIQNINSDKNGDSTLLVEWMMFRDAMAQTVPGSVLNPMRLVLHTHKIAMEKGRQFVGWSQNDMPEFLLFMLECIHSSVSRPVELVLNNKPTDKMTDQDNLALICLTAIQKFYEKEYSEFVDIFYGVQVSRITSIDGGNPYSTNAEMYCTLDLELPQNTTTATLYDCLDSFTSRETIHDWRNEDTTGQIEVVHKQILFWSTPKILVIILKRYSTDGRRRNNSLIDFPIDRLDLKKYVVGYKSSNSLYNLFGVANHMGTPSGGHYTAFVRTQRDNRWWHCNDSHIEPVGDSRLVISPNAYCLFYRLST